MRKPKLPSRMPASDEKYLKLITDAVAVCADYKPKFGQGRKAGLTLAEFQELYESDEFYSWFGLSSPLMYAAHKAAGGMTSIYRQIGMGCQWVFAEVLQDHLGLTAEAAEVTRADSNRVCLRSSWLMTGAPYPPRLNSPRTRKQAVMASLIAGFVTA